MNPLLLLVELFITPLVPEGYQYDRGKQKILHNREFVTTADCRDYAMLTLNSGTDTYLILSRCTEEWRLTHSDGSSQSLEDQASQLNTKYLSLRQGEALWLVNIADHERLLYLSSKGITEIRDFRYLEGGWLLQTGGFWIFVREPHESSTELIRLAPLFNDNERNPIYWNALSGGGYLSSEKILALVFYIGGERHFSLYDTVAGTWRLRPPELLLPEERQALERGHNVIFRLAIPAGNARLYYDIYNGTEKIGRSAFHHEGESVIFSFKAQPGRHLIRLDRFTAAAGKQDAGFVREKNIRQLEPISVNVPTDRAVLIYIRPGKKNENKPLVLDYSYLPIAP